MATVIPQGARNLQTLVCDPAAAAAFAAFAAAAAAFAAAAATEQITNTSYARISEVRYAV